MEGEYGGGRVSSPPAGALDDLPGRRLVATNVRGMTTAKTTATNMPMTNGEKNPEDPPPDVTVKVTVAEPPVDASIAVSAYMPVGTDGTVNVALTPPNPSANTVLTVVVPKLMLTEPLGVKPAPVAVTVAPTPPCDGVTATEPIVFTGVFWGYWVVVGVAVGDPDVAGP